MSTTPPAALAPAQPPRHRGGVLVATLLDLVLPVACAGCGAAAGPLCRPCGGLLGGPAGPVAPRPPPAGFPPCRAVAAYQGSVRSTLIAYKERGRRDLAGVLGGALARSVAAHPGMAARAGTTCAGTVVLVPVPSRAAAVRARGSDTTARLASVAAHVLQRAGVPARVDPVLRLRRGTADSAGLSIEARAANLAGAMVAARAPVGDGVVIVDDLLTTGATLAEAARALSTAGRSGAAAATVATTVRWAGVGRDDQPR